MKGLTKKEMLYYPHRDTFLMVEGFIKKNSGKYKKRQLWEHLPKKIMYKTYCIVFDYLKDSGKTILDKNRCIVWVGNQNKVFRELIPR